MKVFYPPVGIAHITRDVTDLVTDRVQGCDSVQTACVMQPKANPHFGTMIVLMTTFALAERMRDRFAMPTEVVIDVLENSPSTQVIGDGERYSVCLSHSCEGGVAESELYTRPIRVLADFLSGASGLRFRVRSYAEIQAQDAFRTGMLSVLRRRDEFDPIVSPSEHQLRIRPVCGRCGIVDKTSESVVFHDGPSGPRLSASCPNCGLFDVPLADKSSIIDANSPIRTILRSHAFILQRIATRQETVIVNGSDWAGVWMQRVYFDGLALLGHCGKATPMNYFSPQVLDESGAKLSKTIYLEDGAYSHLNPAWLSATEFVRAFGEAGVMKLFGEVRSWAREPRRLFRDYSLGYFEELFEKR